MDNTLVSDARPAGSNHLLKILGIGFGVSIVFGVVCLDLFVLGRKEPHLPRPYQAIGYQILPAVVLLIAAVFLVGYVVSNPVNSLYSLAIVAMFYPAYRLLKWVSGGGSVIETA
ncbi:MAG: hypothetical protein QUS14_07440 [Pyrinomonadaceae bacterium]|nr:hypothetical protein [Pyrinomonadaceae bacterium]